MAYPFPGMNPYLERRSLWPDVHLELIRAIRFAITRSVPPRYYVSAEERTYIASFDPDSFVGRPDVAVIGPPRSVAVQTRAVAMNGSPVTVLLPVTEEVLERFLEIRDVDTHRVITVLEVLSPANKISPEGRRQYEEKRQQVLSTSTSLVEIELLRLGEPLPARHQPESHYRILVSRSWERPPRCSILLILPMPFPLCRFRCNGERMK